MFCAPGHSFGCTEGAGSRFYVLRSRTHFRRNRRRRVHSSCFSLQDPFSVVPTASGPVFMFCAPGHIFGRTEGVGSHFFVFRSRSHFRQYRGRLINFDGSEGVGSRFHVLRSRTHFRRYRGRWVLFLCLAHADPFSVVPTVSISVFMFCASGHIFGGIKGVGSRFQL
jgi:hypothetical protein